MVKLSLTSFLLGAAFASSAWSQVPASQAAPVGLRFQHYVDTDRMSWAGTAPRPLQTSIWYPAAEGSPVKPWDVAIFKAGNNATGAPMATLPERFPLIVLSHGTGGSAAAIAWFAEGLAASGYIVAAVNHHGNTAAEEDKRLEGTVVWWDRPRDLSVLIDRLLADPVLGPRIDGTRIGVAGFSLGGYTALAAVGARLSAKQFADSCADPQTASGCKLPPEAGKFTDRDLQRLTTSDPRVVEALKHMEDSYADARFKAAFVMAPVFGYVLTRESLMQVHVPLQLVVGAADEQAFPELSVRHVADTVPGANMEIVPGAGHYVFASLCDDTGMRYVKEICADPAGVDRNAVHNHVVSEAVGFFGKAL